MANSIKKRQYKVIIGVLAVFGGLCLLASNYYLEKKYEVFDDMNELYYNELVELENPTLEIEDEEELAEVIPEEVENPVVSEVVTTKPVEVIDYTKYYVGYLTIPKINLKKGFTDLDNKYNNVNRNIEIIKPSDYPNLKGGNFIIAGHSGSSSVSFFKDLYKLELGDEVFITYKGEEYKYTIKNIYTDLKDGDVAVRRDKEKTTLTLITCTKGDKTTQTIYIAERD